MQNSLEKYLIEIVSGKRYNLLAKMIVILLAILELVYMAGLGLRRWLYSLKIIKRGKLDPQVISVGNITTGGTGKTPVVEKLARRLIKKKKKIVILSRGYGGKQSDPLIVSDGREILVDVETAGDEVYMLARNLMGVPIVTGKDRLEAGRLAVEEFSPDVIILDDGFQHWKLIRDKDIVIIDGLNPFGYFHLLPRGFLREPLKELKRADLFIISKADQISKDEISQIKEKIRSHNKQAEILTARHKPVLLNSLTSKEAIVAVSQLAGKKILAVSGIGNPHSFIQGLEDLGAEVKEEMVYPDHYQYQEEDLMEIAVQAQLNGVDWVITTEKDAVKFTEEMIEQFRRLDVGLYALEIELEILEQNFENHLIG